MRYAQFAAAGLLWAMLNVSCALGQIAAPASAPADGATLFKHLHIDVQKKVVRVDCEVCKADYALEFFCVSSGGNEYESVLRTAAKPSGLHAALLAIGLAAGQPVRYVEASNTWLPPHGPPLQITCEFQKNGKSFTVPAYRLMRNLKTKKEVAPLTWVFTGSKVMEDGGYGADPAGYLISVLNNELTVIDIPVLAGRALETREWEPNLDLLPDPGQPVTLIIEPAGKELPPQFANPAAIAPSGPTTQPLDPDAAPLDVVATEARVRDLKAKWTAQVAPNQDAIRKAAEAHYQIIESLRREQNKLIDESNRIQAVIDELTKQYDGLTAPHPENAPAAGDATGNK